MKKTIKKNITLKNEVPNLNSEVIVKENKEFSGNHERKIHCKVIIIKPRHSTSAYRLNCTGSGRHSTYIGRKPTLILAQNTIGICLEGEWEIEHYSLAELIILIAFVENQFSSLREKKYNTLVHDKKGVIFEHTDDFAIELENNNLSFMHILFKNNASEHVYAIQKLFNCIRKKESYSIVKFLLHHVLDKNRETEANKIYNFCKEYGVSESYFRKLCYDVFSCGPKKKVRMWRAANSALQLIEGDDPISSVAWNNGYASSSHFSTEIKKLFGLTPKEFKNLEGCFNE